VCASRFGRPVSEDRRRRAGLLGFFTMLAALLVGAPSPIHRGILSAGKQLALVFLSECIE
jgi:hypothetical protein